MNVRSIACLLLVAAPAAAQCDGSRMLRSKRNYNNRYGTAMDVDAGWLAVSAPGVNHPFRSGHVYVHDLETLEKLFKLRCDVERSWMGTSLDLDGEQIVIGAPGAGWNNDGRVYLFGLDGAPFEMSSSDALFVLDGPGSGDRFGQSVAMDGNTILVGAPDGDLAYLYDRATGQLLHTLSGEHEFGTSVAIEGDVCAVGTPHGGGIGYGSVSVFDVPTGQLIYEMGPPAPSGGADFGYDIALDAGRLLVGDIGPDRPSYLFEAATGELLAGFANEAGQWQFGYSVALDGDRVLIGEPGAPGISHLFDVSGAPLAVLEPEVKSQWARSGREVVLGEGWSLIGAPLDSELNNSVGSIWISRLGDALVEVYCAPAVPNSTGVPAKIRADACGFLHEGHLGIGATNLPPNQFGLFLVSPAQDFVQGPGGSQGNLCLGAPIGRFQSHLQKPDVAGNIALAVDVTALPMAPAYAIRPGESWNFQMWYRDFNPFAASNFTDAVSVQFPPDKR